MIFVGIRRPEIDKEFLDEYTYIYLFLLNTVSELKNKHDTK